MRVFRLSVLALALLLGPLPALAQGVEDGPYVVLSGLPFTVTLTAGTHTTGFFMGNDSAGAFGDGIALRDGYLAIFVDGIEIDFDVSAGGIVAAGSGAADMYEYSGDFDVTAGDHTILFRISGSGTDRPGISIDDFSLDGVVSGIPGTGGTTMPEPGTLALFGLGLLGLGWMRRRIQIT